MSRALRAEIRRLLARRLTLIALLGVLALIALFQVQVNQLVTPPSAQEVAEAQADYEEYRKDWEANHEEWEAECRASGGTEQDCADDKPLPQDWGVAALPYDEAASTAVTFGAYLAGLVVFVVTASFIGAEVTTGSLANWLTFVPSRRRVLVSKLLVASGFSLLVGLAVGALTVAISAVLTGIHGQPLTGLSDIVAMAARGSLVVGVFGVLGFCVALLTGSTGATIGVLLGGIFVLYVRTILAFGSRWAQWLSPWSPEVTLQAVLNRGTTYLVSSGTRGGSEDYATTERSLSLLHGLGYWAVVLAVLIAVTWHVFRRRDVT